MPSGLLTVTLMEGSNLRDMDIITKMDPYCFLSLGSIRQRSRTHNFGGKNPSWHQTFTFNVMEGMDKLHLEAYDEDTMRDDFIGWAEIPLYPVFSSYVNDGWHNIFTRSGMGAGKIHLNMNFRPGAPMSGYASPVGYAAPPPMPYYPPPPQPMMPPPMMAPPPPVFVPPPPVYAAPAPVFVPPPPVFVPPAPVVVAPPVFIPPPAVIVEPTIGFGGPIIDVHLGRRHHHHHHHGFHVHF